MKNLEMSLEPLQTHNLLCQSGDEDSEYSDESSAQSQNSERTLYDPDLYVLTNDEHWTMTPETHKYAAAAGSFCFSVTENGEQQDICKLITMPCVQRSLCLNGATNDFDNIKVEALRELMVKLEICWSVIWLPADGQQEQEPR